MSDKLDGNTVFLDISLQFAELIFTSVSAVSDVRGLADIQFLTYTLVHNIGSTSDAIACRDGLASTARRKHRFAIRRTPGRFVASTVSASRKAVPRLDTRVSAIKYDFSYLLFQAPLLEDRKVVDGILNGICVREPVQPARGPYIFIVLRDGRATVQIQLAPRM